MKKISSFGLVSLTIGLALLTAISCSKDDDCKTNTYYLDKDKDNFGAGAPTTACKPPKATVGQYVLKNGDTNDNDPNINPGCALAFYVDQDKDGFGAGDPVYFCEDPEDDTYTDFDGAFDCDDTNASINPDVFITYYPDADGDGFGDPNGTTVAVAGCSPAPENHVANSGDCDDTDANRNPEAPQITYYNDSDDDGYGNADEFDVRDACDPAPQFNYSLQAGDCNDSDPSINPDAEENPNDGIDSNCDGTAEATIWTGPTLQFNKPTDADWTIPMNRDQLTGNIALTRHDNGYITNFTWWSNVIEQLPQNDDLEWEYRGRKSSVQPVANVGDAEPSGGPQGVRWAILEQGADTPAWDAFDLYGVLGSPENFYSFNNIASICSLLDSNYNFVNIIDDFGVVSGEEDLPDFTTTSFQSLAGKTLAVWLVEENIYFTLTFTDIPNANVGNEMKYMRSTPNN